MKEIKTSFMNAFGGEEKALIIHWDNITDIGQLPRELQIKASDVKDDATYAHFVCYCDSQKIPMDYITGSSGLTEEEVISLIRDAKDFDLYAELVDGFLK